jgi:hypothetical protein
LAFVLSLLHHQNYEVCELSLFAGTSPTSVNGILPYPTAADCNILSDYHYPLEIMDHGESAMKSISGEVHPHNFAPQLNDEKELISKVSINDREVKFDKQDTPLYEGPSSEFGSHKGYGCRVDHDERDGR